MMAVGMLSSFFFFFSNMIETERCKRRERGNERAEKREE